MNREHDKDDSEKHLFTRTNLQYTDALSKSQLDRRISFLHFDLRETQKHFYSRRRSLLRRFTVVKINLEIANNDAFWNKKTTWYVVLFKGTVTAIFYTKNTKMIQRYFLKKFQEPIFCTFSCGLFNLNYSLCILFLTWNYNIWL